MVLYVTSCQQKQDPRVPRPPGMAPSPPRGARPTVWEPLVNISCSCFLDECGIVAQISQPLADSDISAYYISTFSFDHALVSSSSERPPHEACRLTNTCSITLKKENHFTQSTQTVNFLNMLDILGPIIKKWTHS